MICVISIVQPNNRTCSLKYTLGSGYSKCYKILNTFLFLFSNKMLVFMAGIHKMDVRTANREYPDQTASSEAV